MTRDLLKVGRRQFNPPCREIHGEVDESRSDVCKGYPVKKAIRAPPCSRVCPFFIVGNTSKNLLSGRPLLSLAPSQREKNQFVTVGNKGRRFAFEGSVRNMIMSKFIATKQIRRIRVIANDEMKVRVRSEVE